MARLVRATHDLGVDGGGVAVASSAALAIMDHPDKPGDDDREEESQTIGAPT
jgi:hypothetical protein